MSNIAKDNNYPFSTTTTVRITDINYGKHLGHMSVVGILHNARVQFLTANGFDELDVDGLGVILLNSSYSFKNETYFGEKLLIHVGIGEYSKLKFNFVYKVINEKSSKEVVLGKEEHAFFDYQTKKVSRIPQKFLDFCKDNEVTHCLS